MLPDLTDGSGNTWHLAVGAGKDYNLYVVDRDSMGKFSPGEDNNYQLLWDALPGGIWSMPAYFNNTIYYGTAGGTIRAFPHHQRKAGFCIHRTNCQQFHLSWRNPQHLRQ